MEGNSGVSANFGLKITPKKDNEENNGNVAPVVPPVKEDEELDMPYTDERSVTVALVKKYSDFRRANEKVMPKKTDYIGSSISSSRILSSSKGEIETYMPAIIGLASNNDNFVTRVKQYFNNIQIPVNELGKTFDISFRYDTKRDYYKIKAKEDVINAEYDAVPRQNLSKLREALKDKINKLNELESTKYLVGYPKNVEDYLMYRHCLLYNDIAKDIAFINGDKNVRFYFKDNKKEAEKAAKQRLEINKAKANYLSCLNDDELFNAVFIAYCASTGMPILTSLALDETEKQDRLDKFSTEQPSKFNKIFFNKDIKLVGVIETLIARGELMRLPNTQNINSSTGEFIGANMNEAVNWFKNPENNAAVTAYYNKLKLM